MRLASLLTAIALWSPFSMMAQLPELTSSDKAIPIVMQNLEVGVKVIGTRASTTFTITFHNPSDKVLEGSFLLPLPESAAITRYALDVNGRMREGVPVEKAKATEVFESVEKRRIDPGLLERTEGNVFRTRIFPLPAHGERSIIIAYEQELPLMGNGTLRYHLPLVANDTIRRFSLNVDVQQRDHAPVLESTPISELQFLLSKGHYCAHEQRENTRLNKPLTIAITKLNKEAESFVQRTSGRYYFYLQAFVPPAAKSRQMPKNLALIWDNSLSGLYRDTQKEIKLLEAYCKLLGNASVQLYTLNHTFRQAGNYAIQNGNAKALIDQLKNMVYDGGTDYAKIRFTNAEETLLFSDGLSTLSDWGSLRASHPVHTISSSPKADFSQLASIADNNGGMCINLAATGLDDAAAMFSTQTLRFLGIKENKAVTEHYPSTPVVVRNGLALAGIMDAPATTITLQFGYGRKVAFEQTVSLQHDAYGVEEWDLGRLFAQKKIAELDKQYERNKEQILLLGKQHKLVTRNTSLLVLEDVMDYVRNEIEPPMELRAEYKRLLKERRDELSREQHNTLERAATYSQALSNWYRTSYPRKNVGVKKYTTTGIVVDSAAAVDAGSASISEPPPPPNQTTVRDQEVALQEITLAKAEEEEQANRSSNAAGNAAALQHSEVVVMGYSAPLQGKLAGLTATRTSSAALNLGNRLLVVNGRIATVMPPKHLIAATETMEPKAGVAVYGAKAMNGVLLVTTKDADEADPEITLEEKTSSASYMQVLAKAPRSKQYQTYLALRDKNLLNPGFYYDVAGFFLKVDRALGLQVLTNLGELDYQNHELLKLFGFKLKELGEKEQQLYVFRKILQWRPQEPQSYRDYGLALAENGRYQAALDTLYLALAKEYNDNVMANYDGIEETILMDINNLVAKHRAVVNTSKIPPKLLHHLPVDIRVVMNWNMNDTDMDLWITDPNGEKCFYSNSETRIGGRLSEDFTNGYGPEQFLLRKAPKGKYTIEVDYFGNSSVKIAGKTTLMVEVYTHFGRSTEQRRLITLQLEETDRDGIYVGTFTF